MIHWHESRPDAADPPRGGLARSATARHRRWTAVLAAAACAGVLRAQADSGIDEEAAALLDHVTAHTIGSSDYRGRVSSICRGTFTYTVLRAMDEPPTKEGTFEDMVDASGRAWSWAEFDGARFESGYDGTTAWEIDPAIGVRILGGDAKSDSVRMYQLAAYAPWRELYAGAKITGRRTVDGRRCVILTLTPKSGTPEQWYIDPDEARIDRMVSYRSTAWGDRERMMQFCEDYTRIDGLLLSRRRRVVVGQVEIVYTCKTIELGSEIPAERLALPAAVREAIEDPSRVVDPAVRIERLEPQPTLAIRIRVKSDPDAIGRSLELILPEILAYLQDRGVQPTGPPFARYFKTGKTETELEAGFPVPTAVPGKGQVKAGELPGCEAAVAWHLGHYRYLSRTHRRLDYWLKKRSLMCCGSRWEVYYTDPGKAEDPGQWKTLVVCPIKLLPASGREGRRDR